MTSSRRISSTNSACFKASFLRNVVGPLITVVMFGFLSNTPAGAQGLPCSQCGPGAHWVDVCSSGMDEIANQGAVVGIDTDLDCMANISLILHACSVPNNLLRINRSGPRDDSQNFPGLRPVDGHRDVIDTEIILMCLTGNGVTMKAGLGQGNIISRSLGAIAEKVADNKLADSFFDVYFEVDLGGGMFVYNHEPLRMQVGPEGITCAPPNNSTYAHPTGCVWLFTDPRPGMGQHVANLVSAQHFVNPLILGSPHFTQWDLIGIMIVLLVLATCVFFWRRRVIGAKY